MDEEKPPTRRLVLKQREVEPVDKVARPGDGTAISVRLIHLGNKIADERCARIPLGDTRPGAGQGDVEALPEGFKLRDIEPMDPPARQGDEDGITIQGILHENRVAADETAPELVSMPVRRRSRRNRDFAVLIGCAIVSFGTVALVFREARQLVALSLFGIVFVTVILAWIMYGVMDRY